MIRLIVVSFVAMLTVPAGAAPPPPCPVGRYVVQGGPILTGDAAVSTEAIQAGATSIAIGTACAPIVPKRFKGSARGAKVKAVWPSCTGFTGKVRFAGRIVDECATLRGKVKAKRLKAAVEGQRSDDFVTATIGASGGTITSSDGRVTLDVPPGALASDTVISIRPLSTDELPAPLAGAESAYDLGPDGLQFLAPVTVTHGLEPSLGAGGELVVQMSNLVTLSAGQTTPEPLGDQRIVVDADGGATATGTLAHFAPVANGTGLEATFSVGARPGQTIGVNELFEIDVQARILGSPTVFQNPPLAMLHTNRTPPGIIVYRGLLPTLPVGMLVQNTIQDGGQLPYQCGPTPGTGTYLGTLAIDTFPPIDLQLTITCTAPSTTVRTTTTTTTRRTTSTSSTSSTTTSTSTTIVQSTTTTSNTATTTSSSTTTTTSTSVTTTLPQINCCDCPSPRPEVPSGCASGPAVFPQDCTPFGCTFVANAVCTDQGDCVASTTTTVTLPPTTTSSSTTSSSTSTSSTSSSTSTSSTSSSTSTSTSTSSSSTSITTSTIAAQPIDAPEGMRLVDEELYEGMFNNTIAVAARNGWALVDYFSGETVLGDYLGPFPSQLFEVSPLGGSSMPGAGLDVQAIIQAGVAGPAITGYDLDFHDFGFTQIFPGSPTCTDAVPYGGDTLWGGIVLPCARTLRTFEAAPQGFFNSGDTYSGFPTTGGNVMSAFRRAPDGPLVAVTDGTPGTIWKHPGVVGQMPIELGPSGNSPRRVRCTRNSLCAVSNFASDTLTILTWDAGDTITIENTVPVGDGPVGVDTRTRTDGNFEVVSTGFNDDSYSITVLEPDGDVVTNQETAAPAGCDAPGHAIWGTGNDIIISCNGSDDIVRVVLP